MTQAEIVELCRYVRGLAPAQKFDQQTPVTWADVFAGVPITLPEAKQAAASAARHMAFLAPRDIIAEHRRVRNPGPPPPPPRIPRDKLPDPERIAGIVAGIRDALTRRKAATS